MVEIETKIDGVSIRARCTFTHDNLSEEENAEAPGSHAAIVNDLEIMGANGDDIPAFSEGALRRVMTELLEAYVARGGDA